MPQLSERDRYRKARNVTLFGALINALLGVVKLVFGALGHSQALIADGVHSLSDLITDMLVLLASRMGSQKADTNHPYGHRRIETAATMFLALLLIAAGLGIFFDAFWHLHSGEKNVPSSFVLWVAAFSVLANEWLYYYTKLVAKRIDSALLLANAWHHRSDSLSSLVVLLGVLGSLMGYHFFDALAAAVVALLIIKMGVRLGFDSIKELIDTAVDKSQRLSIEKTIAAVPGVQSIHQLRTRSMGGKIFIDVHVHVYPRLSVSEGHYISHRVIDELKAKHRDVADVVVHIDPEDDELFAVDYNLPSRSELIPELKKSLAALPFFETVERIDLHYLAGEIEVNLFMHWQEKTDQQTVSELHQAYQTAAEPIEFVATIVLYFRLDPNTRPIGIAD